MAMQNLEMIGWAMEIEGNEGAWYDISTRKEKKSLFSKPIATGRGRGGNSIVFHLSFLTHSACQYDVT